METYFCAVVVLSFLEENITPITIIAASLIALIGFFIGWLVGHIRNTESTQELMNELEHVRWQLKCANDHGEFLDHEVSVLSKELDRRQNIINAYKIGQESKPEQPQMPDEIPDELLTYHHL